MKSSAKNLDERPVWAASFPALFDLTMPAFDRCNILWLAKLAQRHPLNPRKGFADIVAQFFIFLCFVELIGMSFEQSYPFNRFLEETEEATGVSSAPFQVRR